MKIPEGYQHVMPYLIVKEAKDFITFMKNVFGAKEQLIVPRDERTIMHGEITIGNSTIMFADATNEFPSQNAGLYIHVEDADNTFIKRYKKAAK